MQRLGSQTLTSDALGTTPKICSLEILRIYRATEVIFCSKDISAQEIIGWMGRIPPATEVKILPESSLSIIGSHSKNSAGRLTIRRAVCAGHHPRPTEQSAERLVNLPPRAHFFARSVFFEKWATGRFRAVFGPFLQKTWVGYAEPGAAKGNLPTNGIFSPLDGLGLENPSMATRQRLDFLYAKDWSAGRDWELSNTQTRR